MQSAIDRVMQAYTMIANLTPEQAQATRERLATHLARMDADDKALAVEGLAICADQTECLGEEWREKQHDRQSGQEGSA